MVVKRFTLAGVEVPVKNLMKGVTSKCSLLVFLITSVYVLFTKSLGMYVDWKSIQRISFITIFKIPKKHARFMNALTKNAYEVLVW